MVTPQHNPTASIGDAPVSADQGWRLLQSLPIGLLVLGPDGGAQVLNRQAARLLDVTAADIAGRHWRSWLSLADLESGAPLPRLPRTEEPDDANVCHRLYLVTRADGSQRVVEIWRTDPAPHWPQAWDAVLWLRDCTVAYEQLHRLQRLAAQDHLTNLVNRREFERRLTQALERAQRDGLGHVLLFMDLDRFKQINDRFGHPAGDEVLRQVARILRSTVRERDTLGRLGGDEFGLLMEQCDLDEGRRAAETLARKLRSARFRWHDQPLQLGISVGLVTIDGACTDLQQVWQAADAACYRAKQRLAS